MSRKLFAIVMILTLALVACAPILTGEEFAAAPLAEPQAGFAGGEDNFAVDDTFIEVEAEAALPAAPEPSLERQADGAPGASAAPVERVVIKNANLSIVVDDVAAVVETVSRRAEALGGFVVSSNIYETGYGSGENYQTDKAASLMVRVPAEQLDIVLDEIRAMSVEVRNEVIIGQDVTREYTDLQSRLRNLEASREQLDSIMAETRKTEDVLAVLQELTRVTGEIELIQGQINYISEAAALSAISLDISPNFDELPVTVSPWNPSATARRAIERLIEGLQDLGDFLIVAAICIGPFAIVFGIPGFFGVRAWRRGRVKKAEATASAKAEDAASAKADSD